MFRKNLLTVLVFVCAMISHNSVWAANDNELFIEDFKAKAGEQITLSVKMNNVVEITCFQFDLYLPDGVTIVTEDGEELIDLNQERTTYKKHTLSYMKQSDGAMRIVCNSGTNKVFSGNSGEVVTIVVKVSESIADGEHEQNGNHKDGYESVSQGQHIVFSVTVEGRGSHHIFAVELDFIDDFPGFLDDIVLGGVVVEHLKIGRINSDFHLVNELGVVQVDVLHGLGIYAVLQKKIRLCNRLGTQRVAKCVVSGMLAQKKDDD